MVFNATFNNMSVSYIVAVSWIIDTSICQLYSREQNKLVVKRVQSSRLKPLSVSKNPVSI